MVYRSSEFLTLAGSWAKYQDDEEPEEVDQRLEGMLEDNVRDTLPGAMRVSYDR